MSPKVTPARKRSNVLFISHRWTVQETICKSIDIGCHAIAVKIGNDAFNNFGLLQRIRQRCFGEF
jgi:hypothetical protein